MGKKFLGTEKGGSVSYDSIENFTKPEEVHWKIDNWSEAGILTRICTAFK